MKKWLLIFGLFIVFRDNRALWVPNATIITGGIRESTVRAYADSVFKKAVIEFSSKSAMYWCFTDSMPQNYNDFNVKIRN